MIKTIFFDIDDTLYDHSYHISSAISHIRAIYPLLQNYSEEYLRDLSHSLLEEVHIQLLEGKISVEESRQLRWEKFLTICGDKNPKEDAMEIANIYLDAYYKSERPIPGAIELLNTLRQQGYQIGVISNNLLTEQISKMKRIGISEYIDTFAISEEVGYAKPHPKIFEVALERASINAHEAVFIGDSWESDIVGALRAGIRPVWFNRKALPSADKSIKEIRSFDQKEEIIPYILNDIPTPQITKAEPARL
jgi:putative hydrolase of the HAD superfamily